MSETKQITIQGHTFPITQPYTEGHKCTEAEARALNQTRSENIGNNMRSKLKALLNGGTELTGKALEEANAEVAKYDAEYIFAMPRAGTGTSRKLDPVEREARKIAIESLKGALGEKYGAEGVRKYFGKGVAEEDKEKIEAKIAEYASSDKVMTAARKAVADRAKTVKAVGEDLGL